MNRFLPQRRLALRAIGSIGAGWVGTMAVAADRATPRLIKVTAERYKFTPNQIEVKAGDDVILEFTTLDMPMGFNVPTLKVRTNILPDMPSQLAIKPTQKGRHPFFCDIACGTGHGKMKGVIVVT